MMGEPEGKKFLSVSGQQRPEMQNVFHPPAVPAPRGSIPGHLCRCVRGVEMARTRTPEMSWVSDEIAAEVDWVSRFDIDHRELSRSREG